MSEATSGRIRIRPVRENDADPVCGLAGQLGYVDAPAGFKERIGRLVGDAGQQVLVAETDAGRVVGWIHVFLRGGILSDHQAEIGGLIVDEAVRGCGIGRSLLVSAEAWAVARQCDAVCVRSNVNRAEAPAFYAASGYREIKQQRVLTKAL